MTTGLVTFEISDHLPTFCMIPRLLNKHHQNIMRRSLRHLSVDKYLSDVTDLASLIENLSKTKTMDAESLFNTFFHSFKKTIDKHLLLRKSSKKKNKQMKKTWVTKGILKSIKTKNRLGYFENVTNKTTYSWCHNTNNMPIN